MEGTKSCCASFGDGFSACFTSIGSGLGSASTCISSSCSTLGSSIGSGCSAMGKGISSCCGSFTTCITGFFSDTLWPCLQRMGRAVAHFFSGAWTYIKSDPARVKHVSIGCVAGVVATAATVLCFTKCCKKNDKSEDDTKLAPPQERRRSASSNLSQGSAEA